MRFRPGVIAGGAMVATLVLGAFAIAQPRSGKPAQQAPPRSALPEKHPSSPPPAAPPEPPPEDRSFSTPIASSNRGDAGARLSALNPAPNEFPDAALWSPPVDYATLLADVASLRSRVAAVSDALFHSRIAVSLETSSDHARVTRLSLWLDGGVVWTSPSWLAGGDAVTVYDHAVAPGHHEVAVEVEYREEGDAFRSSQRSRFLVDVPADERLLVDIKAWDGSSMSAFPRDKKGEYDLRIRARESAQPLVR
ncbi:MAG: hypothetical protein M3O36_00265 [Myxococcota bacterium]|nr:hypothetical protein [Myxococcota bacterium]